MFCTATKEIIVEMFTATRRYIIAVASLTGYIGHITSHLHADNRRVTGNKQAKTP